VIIRVDPNGSVPPYEQIRSAIASLADRGDLAVGSRLPTVRQLARDLELSPTTVAHAYRELERDGFVRTAGRRGTFVADRAQLPHTPLDELAVDFVNAARTNGSTDAQILHAIADALHERK
jgi:DNA-binding transcriptional regulator YhcF (GntR family)